MIFVNIVSVVVSVVIVWLLSPVEDKNKPLSANEKKYFKRKSRGFVLICAAGILAGTLFFPHRVEFLAISLGVASVSVSLVAAHIRHSLNPVSDSR
jgi:Na+/H+ antiporter NhaD/arsenite permease-like protein